MRLLWILAHLSMAGCATPDKVAIDSTDTCGGSGVETCNGLDDDCDGLIDEEAIDQVEWYMDRDGDGYGIVGATMSGCHGGGLFVADAGDCDDDDASAYPGASEDPCTDTRDLDCDGLLEPTDVDADGWNECDDCDEGSAQVHPGAVDDCDGLDQDCDGLVDEDAMVYIFYLDADGDGAGDSMSTMEACAAATGYVRIGDDCDDHDSGRAPGLPEICDDWIDQNCSGGDLSCGIWTDESLTASDVRVFGDDAGWVIGTGVRHVGDVSGDGKADLLLGASQVTLAAYRGGGAYLVSEVHEGDHLLGDLSDVKLAGAGYNNQLGFSVAPLGDPDGDGYDDVIIGAPFADGATSGTGAAYVMYGPWVGGVTTADVGATLAGETEGAGWAGYAVDNAGDVNGDGVEDAIVGAPFAYNLDRLDGEAYIVFGPPTDVSLRHADVQIMPQTGGGELGLHLAGVGDMDGDGLDEVVVGWRQTSYYSPGGGAAVILSDPGAGLASVPNEGVALYDDETGCTAAGEFVGAAGDTDGDGYMDVLVGETNSVDNDSLAGAVYLVRGPVGASMSLTAADSQFLGVYGSETAERGTGNGDLDADGYPEIVVGAPGSGESGDLSGSVYVHYGPPPTGTTSHADADVKLSGEGADDYAGYWVALDGDHNGDGYSDLLVGAYGVDTPSDEAGAVYLLYGGPP